MRTATRRARSLGRAPTHGRRASDVEQLFTAVGHSLWRTTRLLRGASVDIDGNGNIPPTAVDEEALS